MPLLRSLCRVYSFSVRPLSSGRHRVLPLRAEEEAQRPEPAGDMGADMNLLKRFPAPKNLLHCAICRALQTSDIRDKLSYIHSSRGRDNKVTLRLQWPKLIEVEGHGAKKIDAERQAAAMACKILQDLGLLGMSNLMDGGDQEESLEAAPVASRTRSRTQSQESRVLPTDSANEDAEASQAMRVFSNPKHLLSTVIQAATSRSSKDYIRYQRMGGRVKTCRLTLQWPEPLTFMARGQRWIETERKAAALACQRLKDLGLLDTHNRPLSNVMYNKSSVQKFQEQQRQAKRFRVPEHLLQRIEDYFYQFPLEPNTGSRFYEDNYDPPYTETSNMSSAFYDPITGRPYTPLSEAEAFLISQSLEERWDNSVALQDLPADHHRDRILSAIKENQVVVIAGDTGCGKTTRIPRYILEDAIQRGYGAHCNMLITQPRRISAVSVAHRVGQELGPSLRRNVGYQVRLESNLPPRGGALLFCTVGVLLKKLQTNPALRGVSHVVVDEVHERDVNTDFLLILLKQVLDVNPDIKIILMSATGDNERISRYFEDCPIVRVPGFMYPVKEHYLEDILPMLGRTSYQNPQARGECVPDPDLISDVILHVDQYGPPGGILCFLPGWQEIRNVQEILQEQLARRNGRHLILPVYSNIPLTNQQAIFERPPPGVRKIVLATNIAETSVTIDDIVHVVDTGMHKEQRYDLRTKVSCLETTWVSKSNVTQRRGRAGRCQPGFSYHLFTHGQHQAMPTFQVAEILRTPLENLVVQAKIHTPEMTAVEFLSQALESPDRCAIMDAVRLLQEIKVLDHNEELTLLGQRVANISTDPSLAKAIVLASIFRCLHPMLVIVACLTKDPFQGGMMNRSEVNQVKQKFSGPSCSDHLVYARVYHAWKEVLGMGNGASRDDFVDDNMLSRSSLRFIQGLVTQFSSNVEDASLVYEANECVNRFALCNQQSDQDELVKGVLLAGLYPKLIQVRRGNVIRGKFRPNNLCYMTKSGPVLLHKSTVNRDVKNVAMPWLTYFQAVKSSGAVFVRDSSMVHPLAVLLMTDSSASVRENGEQMVVSLTDSDLLKLESDPRTITLLSDLRHALKRMVERNLQDQLPPLSVQEEAQYSQLLHILVELLNSTTHCFTSHMEAEE